MRNFLRTFFCPIVFFSTLAVSAQSLQPFSNCPGVSVAITRPGLNATVAPYQIYLIDSAGGIKPSGHPIDHQINGFGLDNTDGFLYGLYETFNVADPFLARVDINGNLENVGTLLPPPAAPLHVGIINTAAGTNDDKDNFYFLALVVNLQNTLDTPQLFVGKVANVSKLTQNDNPLDIKYTPINPGTCLPQLLAAQANPLLGALQDIAFNPGNGNIYTYFRAPGNTPTPGMLAWFNPAVNPTFTCMTPSQPNIPTNDLCGLYFSNDSALFILTTDGKYYKGNTNTGIVSLAAQTALPLLDSNLRGDMASCIGKRPLVAFDNCPGASVAVTRTGINSTRTPYQLFTIDKAGNVQPSGNPMPIQINAFGLNNKDGFLYGLHETDSVTDPWFTRVDKLGSFENISRLTPPPAGGHNLSIINTAAAAMDGNDNYYFTAITADTPLSASSIPGLFLGTIHHVSDLKEGDSIAIHYKVVSIGTCMPEIITGLLNPKEGLLQDISFDPVNHIIYTTFPTSATSPTPAIIGHFNPFAKSPVLNCITPQKPNPPSRDMCGLFSGDDGGLFILTIDGKFYRGNVSTGEITLITQTALPLLGNNLRGDMASCVPKIKRDNDDEDDEDEAGDQDTQNDITADGGLRIAPNPVRTNQMNVSVNSGENARVRLQIIASTGVPVQTRSLTLLAGPNQFPMDVTQLIQGVYTVILQFPSGRVNIAKFVKL